MKQLLDIIAYHQQVSLVQMRETVIQKLQANDFSYSKKIFEKQNIQYIQTYKPNQNELVFEFFKKEAQS